MFQNKAKNKAKKVAQAIKGLDVPHKVRLQEAVEAVRSPLHYSNQEVERAMKTVNDCVKNGIPVTSDGDFRVPLSEM